MMNRILAVVLYLFLAASAAAETTYSFGVLPQRSATLTAQYWNPILKYVGDKCGVTLELGTRKSSQEYSEAEARGEFDFVYNNHIFAPSHAAAAYRVIARPAGDPIHSQIVVPEESPLRTLGQLEGREIGVPQQERIYRLCGADVGPDSGGCDGYAVFGGNQEGVMAQLRSGTIPAAGVNSRVMKEYAARENFKYRALWTSEPYLDLPVAVHPRVPAVAQAVRDALIGMSHEAEGLKILKASAAVIKQQGPSGFVPAQDDDYKNQREVYRILWKKEAR
jgi:phosphonate transport system substrate-binding protein